MYVVWEILIACQIDHLKIWDRKGSLDRKGVNSEHPMQEPYKLVTKNSPYYKCIPYKGD